MRIFKSKIVISLFIVLVVLPLLLSVVFFLYFRQQSIDEFKSLKSRRFESTTLLDRKGKAFYVVGGQKNVNEIELSDISPKLIKAILAVEDKRFYSHFGLDLWRIFGAIYNNIRNPGALQGASTITQQWVRNVFLNHDRTFKRKFLEVWYALGLETYLPKDVILKEYLNNIYFGAGVYGVESAALGYFHKKSSELNWSESCMLAGLIKSPVGMNPLNRSESEDNSKILKRMDICKNLLLELGWMTRENYYASASDKATRLHRPRLRNNSHEFYAIKVIEKAKQILGEEEFNKRPLIIQTSMDLNSQRYMETLAAESLGDSRGFDEVAGLFMNPNTGEVLSMVGGADFSDSQFNKATQAKRQTGSSFKPFLYAAALESGVKTDDVFYDEYTEYMSINSKGEAEFYIPENYNLEYYGELTVREALTYSNNIVSVKILNQIGYANLYKVTDKLFPNLDKKRGLCLALGCSELSLEEMVSAMQIFITGGMYHEPIYIRQITDMENNILYEKKSVQSVRVISKATADEIASILVDVIKLGTGAAAYPKIVKAGGKTGTTNDYRDAWFIGFTDVKNEGNESVVGFWVGNDDNSPTDHVTGGSFPSYMFRDFVQHIYRDYALKGFVKSHR